MSKLNNSYYLETDGSFKGLGKIVKKLLEA